MAEQIGDKPVIGCPEGQWRYSVRGEFYRPDGAKACFVPGGWIAFPPDPDRRPLRDDDGEPQLHRSPELAVAHVEILYGEATGPRYRSGVLESPNRVVIGRDSPLYGHADGAPLPLPDGTVAKSVAEYILFLRGAAEKAGTDCGLVSAVSQSVEFLVLDPFYCRPDARAALVATGDATIVHDGLYEDEYGVGADLLYALRLMEARERLGMADRSSCGRCGRCCVHYSDAYNSMAEHVDTVRWAAEKRDDILAFVHPVTRRAWVADRQADRAMDRCPWLTSDGTTTCAIHATKPLTCRSFLPLDLKTNPRLACGAEFRKGFAAALYRHRDVLNACLREERRLGTP